MNWNSTKCTFLQCTPWQAINKEKCIFWIFVPKLLVPPSPPPIWNGMEWFAWTLRPYCLTADISWKSKKPPWPVYYIKADPKSDIAGLKF